MATVNYSRALVALLASAALFAGCDGSECGGSASCPEPPPLMAAQLTDVEGDIRVDGSLRFISLWGGGEDVSIYLTRGLTMQLDGITRAQAVDLVAGRVIVLPLANVWYEVGLARVRRETRSVQMAIEHDLSVTLVIELGAWTEIPSPDAPPGPPLDLPTTATMTVRGPLRLECWYPTAMGQQYDPEFSSTYCNAVRAEVGLGPLVARSLEL